MDAQAMLSGALCTPLAGFEPMTASPEDKRLTNRTINPMDAPVLCMRACVRACAYTFKYASVK